MSLPIVSGESFAPEGYPGEEPEPSGLTCPSQGLREAEEDCQGAKAELLT